MADGKKKLKNTFFQIALGKKNGEDNYDEEEYLYSAVKKKVVEAQNKENSDYSEKLKNKGPISKSLYRNSYVKKEYELRVIMAYKTGHAGNMSDEKKYDYFLIHPDFIKVNQDNWGKEKTKMNIVEISRTGALPLKTGALPLKRLSPEEQKKFNFADYFYDVFVVEEGETPAPDYINRQNNFKLTHQYKYNNPGEKKIKDYVSEHVDEIRDILHEITTTVLDEASKKSSELFNVLSINIRLEKVYKDSVAFVGMFNKENRETFHLIDDASKKSRELFNALRINTRLEKVYQDSVIFSDMFKREKLAALLENATEKTQDVLDYSFKIDKVSKLLNNANAQSNEFLRLVWLERVARIIRDAEKKSHELINVLNMQAFLKNLLTDAKVKSTVSLDHSFKIEKVAKLLKETIPKNNDLLENVLMQQRVGQMLRKADDKSKELINILNRQTFLKNLLTDAKVKATASLDHSFKIDNVAKLLKETVPKNNDLLENVLMQQRVGQMLRKADDKSKEFINIFNINVFLKNLLTDAKVKASASLDHSFKIDNVAKLLKETETKNNQIMEKVGLVNNARNFSNIFAKEIIEDAKKHVVNVNKIVNDAKVKSEEFINIFNINAFLKNLLTDAKVKATASLDHTFKIERIAELLKETVPKNNDLLKNLLLQQGVGQMLNNAKKQSESVVEHVSRHNNLRVLLLQGHTQSQKLLNDAHKEVVIKFLNEAKDQSNSIIKEVFKNHKIRDIASQLTSKGIGEGLKNVEKKIKNTIELFEDAQKKSKGMLSYVPVFSVIAKMKEAIGRAVKGIGKNNDDDDINFVVTSRPTSAEVRSIINQAEQINEQVQNKNIDSLKESLAKFFNVEEGEENCKVTKVMGNVTPSELFSNTDKNFSGVLNDLIKAQIDDEELKQFLECYERLHNVKLFIDDVGVINGLIDLKCGNPVQTIDNLKENLNPNFIKISNYMDMVESQKKEHNDLNKIKQSVTILNSLFENFGEEHDECIQEIRKHYESGNHDNEIIEAVKYYFSLYAKFLKNNELAKKRKEARIDENENEIIANMENMVMTRKNNIFERPKTATGIMRSHYRLDRLHGARLETGVEKAKESLKKRRANRRPQTAIGTSSGHTVKDDNKPGQGNEEQKGSFEVVESDPESDSARNTGTLPEDGRGLSSQQTSRQSSASASTSTSVSASSENSDMQLENVDYEGDHQTYDTNNMVKKLTQKNNGNDIQSKIVQFVYPDIDSINKFIRSGINFNYSGDNVFVKLYDLIIKMESGEAYKDEIEKLCDALVKNSNNTYEYGKLESYDKDIDIDYLIHDVIFLDKYLKDYLNNIDDNDKFSTVLDLRELKNSRDNRNRIRREIYNGQDSQNVLRHIIRYVHIDDKLKEQKDIDNRNWENKDILTINQAIDGTSLYNTNKLDSKSEYDVYIEKLHKILLNFQNNYRKYDFDIDKLIGDTKKKKKNEEFTINTKLIQTAPKHLTYFLGKDYRYYTDRYKKAIKPFYLFTGITEEDCKTNGVVDPSKKQAVEILINENGYKAVRKLGDVLWTNTNAIIDRFVAKINTLIGSESTNIEPELIKIIFSVDPIIDVGFPDKTDEKKLEDIKENRNGKTYVKNLLIGLGFIQMIKNNYDALKKHMSKALSGVDDNKINEAIKEAVSNIKSGAKNFSTTNMEETLNQGNKSFDESKLNAYIQYLYTIKNPQRQPVRIRGPRGRN